VRFATARGGAERRPLGLPFPSRLDSAGLTQAAEVRVELPAVVVVPTRFGIEHRGPLDLVLRRPAGRSSFAFRDQ
jgi:hypothetical protein